MEYLINLTNEIMNEHGLNKVFYFRREIIHIKHILKTLFNTGNSDEKKQFIINELQELNMDLFDYMAYATQKIRKLLKTNRHIEKNDATNLLFTDFVNLMKSLHLYRNFNPLIILDHDGVMTNKTFQDIYLPNILNEYKVYMVTANPTLDLSHIDNRIEIYQRKGKLQKFVALKNIAICNTDRPIFYIDDEEMYLNKGIILFFHCYQLKGNKIKKFGNKK